jgi:hypothetical protein
MRIDIKTNFPEVQRSLDRLRSDIASRVAATSVNRTLEQARTQMTREITSEYRVTSAYVRERLAIRRASFKAGVFGIKGELVGGSNRKRSANLINFVSKVQRVAGGGRRRKDGSVAQLTFQVRKAGGKQTITGAFIGNKGRTVFIRTGKGRLPIKPLRTIDVAQMFNQKRINARVVGAIRDRFPVIFAREAKFALAKFNAGR